MIERVVNVPFKKLHPEAKIFTRATDGSVGYDAYALEDTKIAAGQTALVRTGVSVAIPEGWVMDVRPRSGMSLKTKIRLPNSPGTIDPDYRGECFIMMENTGTEEVLLQKGLRIAQVLFLPVYLPEFYEVEELPDTKRGDGGFGSTGV